MRTDGDVNLNFVWYKNDCCSALESKKIESVRKPADHFCILPIYSYTRVSYTPDLLVNMTIDGKNNTVYTWYRNEFVSAGSPNNLGSKRDSCHYNLAINFKTGRESKPENSWANTMDGKYNRTIVFYKHGYVSVGRTEEVDYFSDAYCVVKRPAININPKHFLAHASIIWFNMFLFGRKDLSRTKYLS